MKINTINGFKDFSDEIHKIGFCLSGDNGEEIFSLRDYYSDDINYHTGDENLDPWEWRIRAIKEYDNISYGKVFFNKAGWITIDWITEFISVRRAGKSFDDLYQDGLMTYMEKQVYNLIEQNKRVSVYELNIEFGKSNKNKISKALTSLQMRLLITICDEAFKISSKGIPYGWPTTVFCTIEEKFGSQITEKAKDIEPSVAYSKIAEHIKQQNPNASDKRMKAFIRKY